MSDNSIDDRIKENYNKYYETIESIGNGAYGYIFKGKDKKTDELRAIKVINKNKIKDDLMNKYMTDDIEDYLKDYINSFIQEYEIMKICSNNNTNDNSVKCYKYFNTEKEFVIIMELCDDNLLKVLIKNKKSLTIQELYKIMIQLNKTFKIMKENSIIHRDLKIENILVKYEDKERKKYIVKLTDYGISKKLFSLSKNCQTYAGTLATMAPEILKGEGQEKYNYKCDLWSIGIIIYRLVFREAPYKGETDTAMLNQIKHFGIKKLKKTNDKELDDLIVKLIEEDPAKRLDWDGYLNHPFFNSNKFIEKIEMRKIVPLIGMAKTGKSSLLNIIYNFDLLYTGNSPTYHIIIIRYNPKIPEPCFFHLKVVKNNEEYSFYKNPDYNVRNGRKEIINEIGNIHNKLTKLKKFNYEDNFYLLEINVTTLYKR